MEPIPPLVLKKLWNMARLMLFTLRKGASKTRLMLDLHMMIKRGKVARKALSNLMLHHHRHHHDDDSHGSSSDSPVPFDYPAEGEYEFSCSSTPAWYPYNFFRPSSKRSNKTHAPPPEDCYTAEESPIFRRSPVAARPLRITDSPFPLTDGDEDGHVDRAAEEFIERFYRDLRLQKRMSGSETPY